MENPGNSFEELKQGSKSAQTDTLSPEMIKSPGNLPFPTYMRFLYC